MPGMREPAAAGPATAAIANTVVTAAATPVALPHLAMILRFMTMTRAASRSLLSGSTYNSKTWKSIKPVFVWLRKQQYSRLLKIHHESKVCSMIFRGLDRIGVAPSGEARQAGDRDCTQPPQGRRQR